MRFVEQAPILGTIHSLKAEAVKLISNFPFEPNFKAHITSLHSISEHFPKVVVAAAYEMNKQIVTHYKS